MVKEESRNQETMKRIEKKRRRSTFFRHPYHFFHNFPDFRSYEVPYRVLCCQRYNYSKKLYDNQFLYELKMQEAMQSTAYDAMRFHRHVVYTTLWPPLHTKKEIENVINQMYRLTPKQDKRLKTLLSEEIR